MVSERLIQTVMTAEFIRVPIGAVRSAEARFLNSSRQ